MKSRGKLALGILLAIIAITSADGHVFLARSVLGSERLMSDMIPHSMMPSSDLAQVDINIGKIPQGYTERGTSFYIGNDFWISARHVVNTECARVVMVVDGKNFDAQIKYLDENADLAVLQAHIPAAPALKLGDVGDDDNASAYAFGYPQGSLGATADSYLGRTRLKFGGLLSGTAPVIAWTEDDRYPADFDSLAGISGGPIIDTNGNAVGIIVAASSRRGRNYTVAPEILLAAERQMAGDGGIPGQSPARDVVAPPVVLANAAQAMEKSVRIVETYCIPGE